MNNQTSQQTQTQPLPQPNKPSKWLTATFLALALIGFADATYLTVKHFRGEVPECNILSGCEIVTTSAYSTIGPVPLALMGALYYLTISVLIFAYLDVKNRKLFDIAAALTVFGFVTSLFLVYLQLFVLNAICIYCMASALISTFLLILTIVYWKQKRLPAGRQVDTI